ncbi:MAG: MotA/TolQ/ExbB proton channel family protein [Treponema sp.]|jgi:biopolymer transport protein ExbB|nr:MotA/TolQ/ExbB proton channel family protein [Treponema sp.]
MEGNSVFSLLEFFKMGGVFMWPLLVFSVAATAISMDRILYLCRHDLRIDRLFPKVMDSIRGRNVSAAAGFLEPLAGKSMGARVLLTLVRHTELSEGRLEKAVETEARGCINSLESGFNFLTAIGSLAPLTGFLGTVSGMIGAFRSIAEATEVNAQIVANGIYEALITTVFGLIIAIIAMTAHYILTSVVDRFTVRTEQVCSELITALAKPVPGDFPGRAETWLPQDSAGAAGGMGHAD